MDIEHNQTEEENKLQIPFIELERSPSGDITYFTEYDERYLDPEQRKKVEEFGTENSGNVSSLHINILENDSQFRGAKVLLDNKGTPQFLLFSEEIDSAVRKEQDILERSTRDSLTGLYNREGWNTELKKLSESIQRGDLNGKYVTIVMFDLNHLKEINDTLGHANGDKLLIDMARSLERSFRLNDIVSRWGGDEFAALAVSDSKLSDTLEKRLKFLSDGDPQYSAGILSVKVDAILEEINSPQAVENQLRTKEVFSNLLEKVKETDKILYQAKEISRQSSKRPTTILSRDY